MSYTSNTENIELFARYFKFKSIYSNKTDVLDNNRQINHKCVQCMSV